MLRQEGTEEPILQVFPASRTLADVTRSAVWELVRRGPFCRNGFIKNPQMFLFI